MINSTKYASNEKTQGVEYKCGRFRGSVSMGIPCGFPRDFALGMGWVWGLKPNPHSSPVPLASPLLCAAACQENNGRQPDLPNSGWNLS